MKKCVERLWVDTGAEDDEEFGEPGRVRGPSRRGDEVAVGDGFGHGEIDVGATCLRDVRSDRRISAAPSSFEDTCRGEDLCRMADGGDRFVRLCEMMDDFDDARDEANIFGCATSGEDQGVVLLGLDLIEGGVEREVVATLFGVGLIALEIVDGGANGFARFFAGTDGVDGGADHQQRLERDHVSVVFDVIADQHENGFLRHRGLRNWKRVTEIKMPTERPRLHHEWKSATSRVGGRLATGALFTHDGSTVKPIVEGVTAKIPGAEEIVFGTCSSDGWPGFTINEKHVVAFTPPSVLILQDGHADPDEMSATRGVQPDVVLLAVEVWLPFDLGITIALPVGGPAVVGLGLAELCVKVERSPRERL